MRKILKIAAVVLILLILAGGIAFYWLSRPEVARFSTAELSGRVPVMAAQHPETFPTVKVLEATGRSEEHTSELQSLMRISYAVFCLKKKTHRNNKQIYT